MLEITVDRLKDLENALDNYIKNKQIINDQKQYNKFLISCLQSRWRKHWSKSYKHNPRYAILKIILTKYGTIKLTGENYVVITSNINVLYCTLCDFVNYSKMSTCKHNLELWNTLLPPLDGRH